MIDLQSFIQEHVERISLRHVTVKHPVGRKDVWVVCIDPDAQRRLDGGRTWLDMVYFDTVDIALEAAQKVSVVLEVHWQAKQALMIAGQAVYNVAAQEASTQKPGVEWRD